jgi:hypothetical protein
LKPNTWVIRSYGGSVDADCEQVVALELQLLSAPVRRDSAAVLALLHPDYVEFGASGRVWMRETVVEATASDDDHIEATEMAAVKLSPTVVLLTYRARRPSRVALRSSIWTWSDETGWLMRFHQGTTVSQ